MSDRTGALARRVGPKRGALGLLATIAAPFVIRKLMARRSARPAF